MYSFDTSAFMDWQARHYPLDVFVSLEARLGNLFATGHGAAVSLVREEIAAIGTPGLQAWSNSHKALFIPLASDIQAAGALIEAGYPDLMDPKGLHESADAYVIALARVRDGIVVSKETSAAEKHKPKKAHYIPDVCRELGVPCINLLGLMRREGWTL
jgi:hypothetical protein